jgi:RNA polymerase sigma-70 factor (ECF subfamily)
MEHTFDQILLCEVDSVHRLACRLCQNIHEAEDLVQETYLRALKASHMYKPGEHGVRPWLFKIMHNVLYSRRLRDYRGRRALRQRLHEQPTQHAVAPAVPEMMRGDAREGLIDWETVDERLFWAIQLLPIPHRTVFLLVAVEDFKYREVAEIVGVPVGTVMSRLSRARTALMVQLGDLAIEKNLQSNGQTDFRVGSLAGSKE